MPDPEWTIGHHRGKLCLVYRDPSGKRQRRSLGTSDPHEARRIAPALYTELTRPVADTVEALWRSYTAAMTGRAITTTLTHTWKAISPMFAVLPAHAITVEHCKAHMARRRDAGIKDGTIHTELGHLRMVLLWAEKSGYIDRAPHIERPAKPKPKDRHLTRREVRRLIDACDAPHLRLFTILGVATAGRVQAILGLTWDRVDFERGRIVLEDPDVTIPHKGRAIVPITRQARAALREAHQAALTRYVIEYAGRRVGSVKKGLASAGKRAGLAKVSPHMLRHSAAVHMAEAGVPMEEIASYLGHSDVRITRQVYARFSPDYLAGAAEALNYDDMAEAASGTLVPKNHPRCG